MPSPQSVAMLMRAMEEAGQGVLPFMRKMKFAPKAEQTANLMEGLGGLVAPRQARPWDRLLDLINNFQGIKPAPGLGMINEGGHIHAGFKGPGSPSMLTASFKKYPHAPERIRLDYLESEAKARGGPFESKFSREGRPKGVPPVDLTSVQRQQGVDRIMDVLRQAGFKEMTFEATPGGRPRLYQQMTGYKPVATEGARGPFPTWKMDISSPAQRELPLRGKGPKQKFGAPRAAVTRGGTGTQWLQQLSPQTPLNPFYAEQALGMSAEEALHLGLLREHGGNLFMTERGLATVREWLGNLGGS